MAFTINHIVLVGGNLTRDAELKYASTGNARLTFSVAMNRSYKDPNGQMKEVAEFFDVVYWGKIAEAVAPRLKKGQKVAIEGRLSQRRYTGQDGQQRNIVEVSRQRDLTGARVTPVPSMIPPTDRESMNRHQATPRAPAQPQTYGQGGNDRAPRGPNRRRPIDEFPPRVR